MCVICVWCVTHQKAGDIMYLLAVCYVGLWCVWWGGAWALAHFDSLLSLAVAAYLLYRYFTPLSFPTAFVLCARVDVYVYVCVCVC